MINDEDVTSERHNGRALSIKVQEVPPKFGEVSPQKFDKAYKAWCKRRGINSSSTRNLLYGRKDGIQE